MFRRLLMMLLAFSSSAFALESKNILTLNPEVQRGDIYQPQGFWPLLGVGMGITDSNHKIRTGGMPMHLKVLGSYYFEGYPIVGDVGLGFHNHFLTQNGSDADNIQSLYTELAGRYQIADRLQIGVVWNTLVDNPDRYQSNTNNLASFIGMQVLKEWPWQNKYVMRAGGRIMTDVGISGASINTILAELEVSFGSPGVVAQVRPVPEEPAKVVVAPHLARQAMRTIRIEPGPVNFETDSTRLNAGSQQYLRRLARALAANRDLFDHVQVIGHTDQRGTDKYNDQLSRRRAETIANSLVSAGLSKAQVTSVAKGKKELLTQSMAPSALERNRRVELRFEGVKNQIALKNLIDSISR